jgi:hypothetical protein
VLDNIFLKGVVRKTKKMPQNSQPGEVRKSVNKKSEEIKNIN